MQFKTFKGLPICRVFDDDKSLGMFLANHQHEYEYWEIINETSRNT